MWADVNTCEQSILFHCLCVCFSCDSGGDCECLCTAIAAYAEECNRRGVYIRWRSQELCRMSKSNDAFTPPHSHTPSSVQACLFLSYCLSVTFCFPAALQCENGLVYDPCGPACSPSCPSVQQSPHSQCGALSCVEGCFCPAGMVLHGKSDLQTNPEPSTLMSTYFYVFMGIFQSFMDFQILLNTWYAPQRMMFHALVTSLFHLAP